MANYQTVVVTGCNRGLGLEFVRQLAPDCERLLATCRSPENAGELSQLAAQLTNVELVPLEVTNQAQIDNLGATLKGEPIDLLINNAGVGNWGRYPQDVELWEQTFRINAIAPVKIAEVLASNVAASKRKLIANLTSKMGSIADNSSGGSIIYRTSKAALNAAMASFAIDHAEQGITTMLFHPGWVRTAMGGPNGLIDATESVAGIKATLDQADQSLNGTFVDYQGQQVPW